MLITQTEKQMQNALPLDVKHFEKLDERRLFIRIAYSSYRMQGYRANEAMYLAESEWAAQLSTRWTTVDTSHD